MYVFGGWIPIPEAEKEKAIGTEWICTNSLNVLNLGESGQKEVRYKRGTGH